MPYRNGNNPPNKHLWTDTEISYLKENFYSQTNSQLAAGLGLKLTSVRTKCYELGLKRMELEYWTDEQVAFLLENYKQYGDKELAKIFNSKWKKNKGWTLKHIEKKRKYLKLKRTAADHRKIKDRAISKGVYIEGLKKMWAKRGVAKEGEIRYWKANGTNRLFPVIKINGRFTHWTPYAWEKHFGKIPDGKNVVFKDRNPFNLDPNNLELVTNAELARKNSKISSQGLSDNYVAGIMTHRDPETRKLLKENPYLINLKRKSILLNRTINEQAINQTT
jgi:hypothetical protein